MQRIGKSVVFNASDPDQAAMLEHASQRSAFSAYVKWLIYADMKGTAVHAQREPVETNLMEGFI